MLPQALSLFDELGAMAETAREGTPDRLDSARERLRSATRRHRAQVGRLQSILSGIERKEAAILEVLKQEAEQGRFSIDLDETIEEYEETERQFRDLFQPQIELAEQLRKEHFSLPLSPEERAQGIVVFDRQIEIFTRALELVRDLRWNLMALRAKVEEPGKHDIYRRR